MLAVVEDEQRLLSLEGANEVLDRIAFGRERKLECLRDGARDVVAAGQWCEFDEPHAVAETLDKICRDLQGRARLADATRAGQRHEPMLVHERGDLDDVLFATDEGGELSRQVV